ncbi:guanylate kinase [Limosilactobacillus mucosae]|uniref:Guanylate kinase n=2 Tax=Limosilactobacillus mucosae TaxID=97478 RepID=A0A0R1P9E4_LIMMU|nr:guanylate kinase [Limosilactobacillus mucosae]KRL24888.1 guanylate kinase [Limosilactobacillus mucosae DSM 13345]QOL69723.1 guanylate kinase [Limosilactobacillus mucosae]
MSKRGMLIVLSGPSGVGKGTVRKALFSQPGNDFQYSVSMTTRQPRPGEINGKDYFFVSKEEFEQHIREGQMLEYAKYVDNYYGTPLKYINDTLDEGKDVFLEIEVNGAMQVRSKCPDGVFIFLTPPDLMELRQRLIHRGTDSMEVINKRIHKAFGEIQMMQNYDYAVVNDQVDNAVTKIKDIIRSERLRVPRVMPDYLEMLGDSEK